MNFIANFSLFLFRLFVVFAYAVFLVFYMFGVPFFAGFAASYLNIEFIKLPTGIPVTVFYFLIFWVIFLYLGNKFFFDKTRNIYIKLLYLDWRTE